MKLKLLTWAAIVVAVALSCDKESKKDSSAGAPAAVPATETATQIDGAATTFVGTVAIQLAPKDGAPTSSIANAALTVEDRPELKATTDAEGKATLPAAVPGTVNIIVLSDSGASLTAAASTYGLRLTDVVIAAGQTTDLGTKTLQETGTLTGRVGFLGSPAGVDPAGTLVFLPGTAFSAYTDANGAFALPGIPPGTYDVYVQRDGFSVTKLMAVVIGEGATKDLRNVTLSLSNGPEGGIAVTADLEKTIGDKSRKIMIDNDVAVTLTYDSDAVLMKLSDEPSFLNKAWEPIKENATWTFTSDGAKSLYVTYSDLNGLESSPYSVDFIVDTQAPTLASITALRGWAQSDSTQIFLTAEATDSGTGIADIAFSNTSTTVAENNWVPFTSPIDWPLDGGVGAKTVYAKVRDYAGRESAVASDGIALGTTTVIHPKTYSETVLLDIERSPYLLSDTVVFDGDLEIDAGVSITIPAGKSLIVKGRFVGNGTSGQPIQFNRTDVNACDGGSETQLSLDQGDPGKSEASVVNYVYFNDVWVNANGGTFTEASFRSPDCSASYGRLRKVGLAPLTLKNIHFSDWGMVYVMGGDGLTTIDSASGDLFGIRQEGATNTKLKNNSLTFNGTGGGNGALYIKDGKFDLQGTNTFTMSSASTRPIFENYSSTAQVFSGVVVNGSSCGYLIVQSGTGAISVDRTTAACEAGVYFGGITTLGAVTIDRSALTFSSTDHGSLMRSEANPSPQLTMTRNSIAMSAANLKRFDLFFTEYPTLLNAGTLNMSTNNISCLSASNCRGGLVLLNYGSNVVPAGGPGVFTASLTGNYWGVGRAPTSSIASNIEKSQTTGVAAYDHATEIRIYEFDAGYVATDCINYTYNVTAASNLGTAATVGPTAP